MKHDEALQLVRSFWPAEQPFPFGGGDPHAVDRLQREYRHALPEELRLYVSSYGPSTTYSFDSIGNPIDVYGVQQLSSKADGYNWNPLSGQRIEDWSPTWFLIGDEGGDPIIVDLAHSRLQDDPCVVLKAPHGEGTWEFFELASSLPLCLVLVAAQHHALSGFVNWGDATTNSDTGGLNLCDAAASWYFPFLKRVAPDEYDAWAGMLFDNA